MRIDFHDLLLWLRKALWIGIWIGSVILLGIWSTLAGIIMLGVGPIVYFFFLRKSLEASIPNSGKPDASPSVPTEREALYIVTQLLKNLTRVQVAYLCQDFKSRSESRAWLKRALPRNYRQNFDEFYRSLEAARLGEPVGELELARRILTKKDELLTTVDALKKVHKNWPMHAMAHPVIFVVTENLHTSDTGNEPMVITQASFNPTQPTLLPEVDVLTFFSEVDSGRHIRGQADFQSTHDALSDFLKCVEKQPIIYATEPVEDPAKHGVRLARVPLGFVIGAAELM